jgi:hypothetical protein
MASFCAKCGTVLTTDNQFCPACGTSSAPGQVAAAPVQQVPVPAPPPAKSGSSALKIILIVVAIFVGLGILGVATVGYGIWRVAHRMGISTNGDQVTLKTSDGTLKFDASQTYGAAELGTDVYPGAQAIKGGAKMSLPTGSMVTGVFTTTDSKDQVVAFYKSKFGSDASVMDMPDAAIMTLKKGEQESVMVTATSKASENDGKTKIVIVHTTNTKPS